MTPRAFVNACDPLQPSQPAEESASVRSEKLVHDWYSFQELSFRRFPRRSHDEGVDLLDCLSSGGVQLSHVRPLLHFAWMRLFGKRAKASPEAGKIRENTLKIQETAIARQKVSGEILETAKKLQETTAARQEVTGEMLGKARTHQERAQLIQQMSLENAERHSKLLERWEGQAQRFDDILTKWERMK